MVIPLRGPARHLTCGPLQQPRRQPARRERPGRRLANPLAGEIAARGEGEREGTVRKAAADRQLGHERHPRADPLARQAAPSSERHSPGDCDERPRVCGQEPRQDATADLPLFRPDGQRRGELVQRGSGRGGREPVEVVGQTFLQGGADAREERVRVQPFERTWPLLAGGAREHGHRLSPRRSALRAAQIVQFEETACVKSRVSHATSGYRLRANWGNSPAKEKN